MSTVLLLNLTQGTFITVDGIQTPVYHAKLLELLTPVDKNTGSHWSRKDVIKIVPPHLQDYVKRNYGEINKDF